MAVAVFMLAMVARSEDVQEQLEPRNAIRLHSDPALGVLHYP